MAVIGGFEMWRVSLDVVCFLLPQNPKIILRPLLQENVRSLIYSIQYKGSEFITEIIFVNNYRYNIVLYIIQYIRTYVLESVTGFSIKFIGDWTVLQIMYDDLGLLGLTQNNCSLNSLLKYMYFLCILNARCTINDKKK